jgi:hypothetical protein
VHEVDDAWLPQDFVMPEDRIEGHTSRPRYTLDTNDRRWLQSMQAKARLSGSSVPPCFFGLMCSI